jgi:hypothetical protein
MALYFRNQTNQMVSVALGYSWPNCPDGDNWAKKGWWRISPGGTVCVRGGASNGAKYFWHARADNGAEWGGDFAVDLPWSAFDWCWPTSSTSSTRRSMRKLIVSATSVNHTIVLQFS